MNAFRGSRHAPRNFSHHYCYHQRHPLRLFCGLCGVIIIIPLLNLNVEEKNATHWFFALRHTGQCYLWFTH